MSNHIAKLSVSTHVLTSKEEAFNRAHLLLARIARRSRDIAFNIDDCTVEKKEEVEKETVEFLWEMSHVLEYVAQSLAADGEDLSDIIADSPNAADAEKK